MKLSAETKLKAFEYVRKIKAQVEQELGFEIKTKTLQPLRQIYEYELHKRERTERILALTVEAESLGYKLVKIGKVAQ
jgi:hypothetical protein